MSYIYNENEPKIEAEFSWGEWESIQQQFESRLPQQLQAEIEDTTKELSIPEKILMFKIIDETLLWNERHVSIFNEVLLSVPHTHMAFVVSLMRDFIRPVLLIFIRVVSSIDPYFSEELVTQISVGEIHKLFDVAQFLDETEINDMIAIIHKLSFRELLHMLDHCNEPMAKHCRLCRVKRIHELEFRLNEGQVPKDIPQVPGNLPLYHSPEVWQADDVQGYTFDIEKGLVFYFKQLVDMVRICDKCLVDVNRAASCDTRWEEFNHVPVDDRKTVLAELRERERSRSDLVTKLSHQVF